MDKEVKRMSKKTYTNPLIFLASSGTDINNSHEGGSGEDWEPTAWDSFLSELGVQGEDWEYAEGFDISDPSTWDSFGFDKEDPDTWDFVIEYL